MGNKPVLGTNFWVTVFSYRIKRENKLSFLSIILNMQHIVLIYTYDKSDWLQGISPENFPE